GGPPRGGRPPPPAAPGRRAPAGPGGGRAPPPPPPEALGSGTVGTAFAARPVRLSARRFWVRHAADSRGAILIDSGAVEAVANARRSLLAAGIVGVRGRFHGGDVVDLVGPDRTVVARGVVEYDAAELATVLGRSTRELPDGMQRPVIHADDLVRV
ncbi:PUA domain-containing protein, partial [Nocardia rhamnosiphila]